MIMVSGIQCHVVWYITNNNSHKSATSTYMAAVLSLIFHINLQRRQMQQVAQKVWYIPSSLCEITPHKTILLPEHSKIHVP
jgi:hypothetical protein